MINRLHQRAYAFSLYRVFVSSSIVQFFHSSNFAIYWQKALLWLDDRLDGPEKARQKFLTQVYLRLQNSFIVQYPSANQFIQRLPTLFDLPSAALTTNDSIDFEAKESAIELSVEPSETTAPKAGLILTHPDPTYPTGIKKYVQEDNVFLQDILENPASRVKLGRRAALLLAAVLFIWWGWPVVMQNVLIPVANSVRNSDIGVVNPILAVVNPDNMTASAESLQMTTLRGTIGKSQDEEQPEIAVISLAQPDDSSVADEGPLVADIATELEQIPDSGILVSPIENGPLARLRDTREASGEVPMVQVITPVPVTGVPDVAAPTPTATSTPVIQIPVSSKRLWSIFTPPESDNGHFWIGRPFSSNYRGQVASPSYQFGSTAGGRYRLHHGLDIPNPNGTPVLSGAIGVVVHAGSDAETLLGPYNNFYGNTVVILLDQKLAVAGGELDVYLLYGHLSALSVKEGERVGEDDIVGVVGMTGIAIGPHLHTEVRLNENKYDMTVNPYLWIKPLANSGAVAIRILTADGRAWTGASFGLARMDGSWGRQIVTYSNEEKMIPDPSWGENGAMGSVPPGRYYLAGNINGEKLRAEFVVRANETTFVELRTRQ